MMLRMVSTREAALIVRELGLKQLAAGRSSLLPHQRGRKVKAKAWQRSRTDFFV